MRPRVAAKVLDLNVTDISGANRATTTLAEAANAATVHERSIHTVDLIVGTNRFNHGLGGRARGCTMCPSVADPAFAWSFAVDGDKQVVITVLSTAQPKATMEIYR